jgi:uncharacterized protein (TIGR02596 family)
MKTNTSRHAFSLVELLIVILIIGIVAGFAVPAVQGMLRSSQLNQASALLSDSMALARQTAISKNRMIEVRFYRFADNEIPGETAEDPATGHFRAFQTFEVSDAGLFAPLTKVVRFPDTIIMNPGIPGGGALSNILGEDRITPAQTPPSMLVTKTKLDAKIDPELPRGVGRNYEYVPMRFMPDGSTNLPPLGAAGTSTGSNPSAGGLWYITVHSFAEWDKLKKAGNTVPPPNYFTWQIDPITGSTKTYRPGVK